MLNLKNVDMKKRLFYVCVLIIATFTIAACSDDNNTPLIPAADLNTTFGSGEAKLTMNYGGAAVVGKQVAFNTSDSKTATLTLKDVIPGEAETLISDIQLIEDKEEYTFEGTTTTTRTAGITISYSGAVKKGDLTLNLNVTMPNTQGWAKTYELGELTKGDEKYWIYSRQGLRPPFKYILKEATRTETVIGSAGYVTIAHTYPAAGTTAQDTINACNITTFTDKFRGALGCLLPQVLQTVTLESDGNITANYSSNPVSFEMSHLIDPQTTTPEMVKALTDGRTWLQSPKNLAYWFEKDNKLYIKLNIAAIVSQSMGNDALSGIISTVLSSDVATIKNLLKGLDTDITKLLVNMDDRTFSQILDWIKNGIPVKVSKANGHTHFYLDREVLDPIMKESPIWLPIIEPMIPQESLSMAMSTINNILLGYAYTSKFELGLDLKQK